MDAPVRGSLRWARASATGLGVAFLSLGGHFAVSRAGVGIVQFILAYGFAAVSVYLLTSAKLTPLKTASTLVCGQVFFHFCFSLPRLSAACGSHHSSPPPAECHPAGAAHNVQLSMVAAHAISGILVALLLCYGDELLFRLVGWIYSRGLAPASGFSEASPSLGIRYLAPAVGSELRWAQPPSRAPPVRAF